MAHAEVNFYRNVYCVMGLPIDAIDMAGAVQHVRDAAFNDKRCFVSTPNLNFVMAAREDAAFRDSVLHSDLCLADGMPLVWVARLLGLPIRERVSGAGLFENLLNHPGPPVKVYFFGGPDGAAEAACLRVNHVQRGLHCVGFDTPGFGSIEQMSSESHIHRINQSGAQFVIVALGAKKGQAWIELNRGRLKAAVICHLGAVVNFAAGTVRRAPAWLQGIGGEWLWRIKEEPGIWRRYWKDGMAFAGHMIKMVIPLLATELFRRSARGKSSSLKISTLRTDKRLTMIIEGDFTHKNLGTFRNVVKFCETEPIELIISMANVSRIDCASIGLLQLASKSGWRVSRQDVPSGVMKFIERCAATHIIT